MTRENTERKKNKSILDEDELRGRVNTEMEEVYSRIEREAETRLRKWGRNVSPNLGGDEIGLRKLGFLNIGPKRG